MSYIKTFGLFLTFLFYGLAAAQVADHPVIAEVYGGGGNSGSYFAYDYIILYNPLSQDIDLSAWSVQYASATSANWSVTNLTGTIAAGSYYVIQQKGGTRGGEELPMMPDVVGTTSLATTSGKVALVSNQDELAVNDPADDAGVIDFVGYGSADAYEGTAAAPSPSNTESIRRLDNNGEPTVNPEGSGYDTDENSTDFFVSVTDGGNPPLPVELVSFSISQNGSSVMLSWVTATEVNNYGFDIERISISSEFNDDIIPGGDKVWESIGFMKGSGNSNHAYAYTFKDNNILAGSVYAYRLKQIDSDGKYRYSQVKIITIGNPDNFKLFQNYPNPFNPSTNIIYELPHKCYTELKIYNALGREVLTLFSGMQEAGKHNVLFNSGSLASGIYFYRLITGEFTMTKMMMLIK